MGWCVYDSMNASLIKKCNDVYENEGVDSAEKLLINYYKTDAKKIKHWIKNSSEVFMNRYDLLEVFFEDHFSGRYHSSVLLGLTIIDGAVNDFTKSKGFFSEGVNLDVWDSLVGCSDGLEKVKNIFNVSRKKTNNDRIEIPYRNGILHGRDLNYANEYVSCKCLALMFAIADWMKGKNSEVSRKSKYYDSLNKTSMGEILRRVYSGKVVDNEIKAWEKREVHIGEDVPKNGSVEDYKGYPYIEVVINMLDSWKNSNYGQLSEYLKSHFPESFSASKRAGECRKLFEHKRLLSFEFKKIEEKACALSEVIVKVKWEENGIVKNTEFILRCVYQGFEGHRDIALPWRENGGWTICSWSINDLY